MHETRAAAPDPVRPRVAGMDSAHDAAEIVALPAVVGGHAARVSGRARILTARGDDLADA